MKRTLIAIGAGVVLVNTAMVGASAVGTLVAAGLVGETWSGTPNAAAVLGTAVGALSVGAVMARRGRRVGLVAAYSIATLGALAAALGVFGSMLPLLLAGMMLLGIGNAAAQLSRYAVAELFAPAQRGLVLGAVVWGGTVGAIVGPNLLGPTAAVAGQTGSPPLVGAYVVALLAMAASAAAALLVPGRHVASTGTQTRAFGLSELLQAEVAIPMAAMVGANFTMVAVMTMTPVHVQLHGQGLHVIGGVLSAHMIGMFALSPLSGRLADWRGGNTVAALGVIALVAASMSAAVLDANDTLGFSVAVFALGLGWNLCWVGASSLLAQRHGEAEIQAQGDVDAVVWTTSTAASLLSGALLATGGFALVGTVAAGVAAIPLVVMTAAGGRRYLQLQEGQS